MYVSTYVLHSYIHTYICRYVKKGTILMYGRCMYVRMLLQSGAQLAVLMLSVHTYIHMYIHTYIQCDNISIQKCTPTHHLIMTACYLQSKGLHITSFTFS